MTQFLSSQYWIAQNAITFVLNAMGDPQKVSVSISSGAVVMAYMPGVEGLGYDNSHSYRRWRLRGYASILQEAVVTHEVSGEPVDTTYPATGEKYVYILIPRNTQTVGEEALIGFAPCEIDYLGYDANGIQVGNNNYYYLYTQGIISASVDSGPRSWSRPIETGTLATDEAYDAGGNNPWFEWNSVTDTVKFMKKIFMDAASWFENLRASAISFVGSGSQDKGTVNCVADFNSLADDSTQGIVTPKYLKDREAQIEQKYLRKDQADSTQYKLTAADLEALNTLKAKIAEIEQSLTLGELNDLTKGTIKNANFIDDFSTGTSWGIFPEGRMQLSTLEVRNSLRVLELIFNRLTATESDYVFTEGGTVEEIVSHDGDQYVLRLKKRNDTDFHAFRMGDVLRGVVNNLANLGGGQFTTSWMRVIAIDTSIPEGETERNNTITVVVYPGMSEDDPPVPVVPGGVNYPPEVHMVLQRWGNAVEPTAQAHANPDYASFIVLNNDGVTYRNTRQACWYLSSIEKRIAMLDGVDAPILRESNYTAFFGLPYNLSTFKGHTMNPTQPYLYVRGAFLQDIHYIDYQGNIIRQERNRGVWTQEDATNDPYVKNDSTFDTCYYNNRKWQVVVSQARALPPSADNADWLMLYEGMTPQYRIIPSVLNVLRNPDGTTSLVNNLITCDVVVDEGGDEPRFAPESEVEVYIGVNGDTPTHVSPYRQHTIAATDHSIEFYLWNKMSEFGEESELGDAIFAYLTGMVSVPIYERGSNGDTPTIDPETGNWIINGVVTEYSSHGDDGHSPKIGNDGYWYEWDATTGAYHKTTYYAEGNQVLAQYSEDCIDWYDVYFSGALWMRTKKTGDAHWGDPFRCVGEKGEGGNYVDSEFAISARLTMPLDDVSSWQDAPPATTSAKPYLWMRQMLREWDTNTNAYVNGWDSFKFTRVTGEKGDTGATGETGPQGPQGVGGSYTLTEYGISASRTNPSDVGNNWNEIPPVTDNSHPYLWARMMLKEWSTATSQYVDAWQTYKYVLMTGPDGLPGRTSKPLRGPSEWNSLSNYLSGTGNELVQDIVYHKDHPYNMYLCMVSNSGVEPNENTTANSNWTAEKPWASAEYREFTASKVLFAVRGKIENADIDDVTIRGTITSETLHVDSSADNKLYILNTGRSITLSPMENRLVVLPLLDDFEDEGTGWSIAGYGVAGTHIQIHTEPLQNVCNWAASDITTWPNENAENLYQLMKYSTLVCADPFQLILGDSTTGTAHSFDGASLWADDYCQGRFSARGMISRFVLVPPGQTLSLTSSIQTINNVRCLVWEIDNASDFDTICMRMVSNRYCAEFAPKTNEKYVFQGGAASISPATYSDWIENFLSYKGLDFNVYNSYGSAAANERNSMQIVLYSAGSSESNGEYILDPPMWEIAAQKKEAGATYDTRFWGMTGIKQID